MKMQTLAQLVDKTADRFPWYSNLLNFNGGNHYDLACLPIINEQVLTKHYYHADLENFVDADSYLTSGTSSGRRKRILWSKNDQNIYLQQRSLIIQNFCGNNFKRACSDLGTGHAAATAKTIFTMMGCETEVIDFSRPIDEHIEIINQFQPQIFFTMPMILDSLIASGKLNFHPAKIILVGDVASIAWQQRVAEYFHISMQDILDLVGSIEIGSIAFFNQKFNRYQFDPWILPEVVPTSFLYPDSPSKEGCGILLITSFAREYFPAIRFVTDDLIEDLQVESKNGNNIYTFKRCLGRFSSIYKHGEKISLNDISDVMAYHLPFVPFDLNDIGGVLSIRIADRKFSAEIIPIIKNDILKKNADIAQMIHSKLVKDIDIAVVDEQQIAKNGSKRRY